VTVSSSASVQTLCEEILDDGRTYPIVALTSRRHEHQPALSVPDAREIVGDAVPIYVIPTGRATIALRWCLPERLNVFGGAARVWWPGVSIDSDPADHPLIFDPSGAYGHRSIQALAGCFQAGPPATAARDRDPIKISDERMAVELAALAHPIGLRMMRAASAKGEASYSAVEASRLLGQPLRLVNHHARILQRAGLMTVDERAQRRGLVELLYAPTARGRQLVAMLAAASGRRSG
jgi:DNA-binding transcriptional ArsR family regulator